MQSLEIEIVIIIEGAKSNLAVHNHYHHGEQHLRLPRGLKGPHHMFECRRTNIMGSLVQDASPFLFPCTIEYSLICAAILYVMWKNISKAAFSQPKTPPGSRHHAHAYRFVELFIHERKRRKETFFPSILTSLPPPFSGNRPTITAWTAPAPTRACSSAS